MLEKLKEQLLVFFKQLDLVQDVMGKVKLLKKNVILVEGGGEF